MNNKERELHLLFNIYRPDFGSSYGGNVYDPIGLSPSLKARDYKDPVLVIEDITDE